MLTRLRIRRFKSLDDVDIPLGQSVVFVGPNNSGKTTALQALALWEVGLRKWLDKRANGPSAEQRIGVAINRRDLISVPVPDANLLWRDLHVRKGIKRDGKSATQNIVIEVVVDGIDAGRPWSCGFEFDYANEESFYCRPLRSSADGTVRMPVPDAATQVRVAFLPAMSGLASEEPKWEAGRINVLIGEGQTAQVLRNLCHQVSERSPADWKELHEVIERMFGVSLDAPSYIPERGEIRMSYRERSVQLALSSSGRGLQQVLLLAAYILGNPRSVLLLDEPDAHLEVLRQREVYRAIGALAQARSCQIVAATHSEVVLDEAADKDVVVAFVGKPHRIDDRARGQVAKSLREIGYAHYQQAETTGWVLYLEGPTDLDILTTFARTLEHPAAKMLERPFFKAVETNLPQRAREHFYGLREAVPELAGIAIFDRLDKELNASAPLVERMWRKREIECYLCTREVLMRYARSHDVPDDLFGPDESKRRASAMAAAVERVESASRILGKPDPWTGDAKVSNEFLEPVFANFFEALGLENLMRKSDFHVLAALVSRNEIDPEITQMLDAIVEVASRAQPARG